MLLSSSHLVRRSCSFFPCPPLPLSRRIASLRIPTLEVEPLELRLNAAITARVCVRSPPDFYGAVIDPGWASARAAKDEKRPTCSAVATKPLNPISRRLLQSEGVLRGSDDQRAIRKECRHSQGQTGRMWERSIIFCLDVKARRHTDVE